MYHSPVLLEESLMFLHLIPDGTYVDVTFGGGGHSAAILQQLGDKGRLFAFDQDSDAQANTAKPPFDTAPGFQFIQSNFRHLKRQLRAYGVLPGTVDGILADLGVSSYQIDTPERGFSYRFDADLDMRMNSDAAQTAGTILNAYSAEQLQEVFSIYGEVRNARTLARACVLAREQRPFRSTGDLVEICDAHRMGERWRYLSQVFQALRMEVNEEVTVLTEFLKDSLEMLRPGGRLVVLTYHSIEDRIVKNIMKTGNPEGEQEKDFYGNIHRPFQLITKKALPPSAAEQKLNTRSRSAKLRAAEKAIDKKKK
ncbi:MAG: 16S rRNA (cytosine(1402)-N(4))-methyltransferase RsmH [Lewinellaceae bacterium]|nr:16S rRNA (cytosine(1402)-N(4))-methyltransferase RsmH [Lewinellaceae bacterium]